jgi:hypothetical protein
MSARVFRLPALPERSEGGPAPKGRARAISKTCHVMLVHTHLHAPNHQIAQSLLSGETKNGRIHSSAELTFFKERSFRKVEAFTTRAAFPSMYFLLLAQKKVPKKKAATAKRPHARHARTPRKIMFQGIISLMGLAVAVPARPPLTLLRMLQGSPSPAGRPLAKMSLWLISLRSVPLPLHRQPHICYLHSGRSNLTIGPDLVIVIRNHTQS